MNKSYKYRLYPTPEQEILISKTFGCVRFIYNKMLADKIQYYAETKQMLKNTPAQYKNEFKWLKEVDCMALSNAQMNLQAAYKNFFRNTKTGFPKFKSKRKDRNSYTTHNTCNNVRIEGMKLRLPKIGLAKIKLHRQIPESHKIKSCTISKTPSGKYFASVMVEYEQEVLQPMINQNNILGLDMDMKNLYTDSQGVRAKYPRYYRQMSDKLVVEQRKLSHCKIGSKNREKQRIRLANLHEKIANQRKDFLHKLSRQLCNEFDGICIEDLNMNTMSQCLKLGKSVMDNGWGMFTALLNYKLAEQGKPLIKIDKWYPSSKTCNICGFVNNNLTLKDREWTCEGCGTTHDRDWNAANNIRDEGIRLLVA